MRYTDHQKLAIHQRNDNILVSAGAGSGKTGVLKARVIQHLKEGKDIDQLIILTFTNAAAFEMKSRIIDAIKEDNALSSQLNKVNLAIISTFDAFCLRLVKQYHYLLDLPSDITIADKIMLMDMETNTLEEVIKEYYLRNDPDFDSLVIRLFQRGDSLIYEAVSNLAAKLQKIPNYESLIMDFKNIYLNDESLQGFLDEFIKQIQKEIGYSKTMANDLLMQLKEIDHDSIRKFEQNFKFSIEPLFEEQNFDTLMTKIMKVDFPRKPTIKGDELIKAILAEFYDPIRENLKKTKETLSSLQATNSKEILQKAKLTESTVLKIVEITGEYLKRLNSKKHELKLFSFGDIADMAIRLLEENKEIRDEFKYRIKEIMIDEYQDTNDLQEYFISLIANDNLFMVGDMKQSIYGFRDANPKNFLKKYHQYKSRIKGQAIDLRENFRSRSEILEDINSCFFETMSESIGGIDYQDDQSLIFGLEDYNKKQNAQKYGIEVAKYDSLVQKEENPDFDRMQEEAKILQRDISSRMQKKYQILDKGEFRDLKYSDICVLLDRKTDFEKITRVLSQNSIPVNLYSDEAFITSPEMQFVSSYLRLLKCFRDNLFLKDNFKSVFYSVSRSFVYQIKDQYIIDFLINENIETCDDLKRISQYPEFFDLYNTALDLSKRIDELTVSRLLVSIYRKLNLYEALSHLDNPGKKEEKLDFFAMNIGSFNDFDFDDLIEYLDLIDKNKDWDIEYSRTNPSFDAVNIMTMHKSKGLQFPIVYVLGLGKKFNFQENKDFFIFDSDYGLITNVIEDGYHQTFLRYLYLTKAKQEYISERIRLLYVAFTRAKENLVLILDDSDLEGGRRKLDDLGYISEDIRLKYNKYSDLLASTKITDSLHQLTIPESVAFEPIQKHDTCKDKIIKKSFDFKTEEIKTKRYSKTASRFQTDEELAAMEYGNQIHGYLENLDFHALEGSLESLPSKVVESVRHLVTLPFFRLDESPNICQEMEFHDQDFGFGVIDLFLEYEKEIIIIDYKLKNLSDDAYESQLQGYRNHIQKRTDKQVFTYLYSVLDKEYKEII